LAVSAAEEDGNPSSFWSEAIPLEIKIWKIHFQQQQQQTDAGMAGSWSLPRLDIIRQRNDREKKKKKTLELFGERDKSSQNSKLKKKLGWCNHLQLVDDSSSFNPIT
jgi:hypothetical protein